MASVALFLAALVLIVVGGVGCITFNDPGFIISLFIVMGGIFLWAISLNYGTPPAAHARDEVLPPAEAPAH